MSFICLYFGLFTLCWKCWKDLFWVLLQVTGSHSDHSAWYHSADGYAHGSWGIKLLIQVFFWQYNPQGSFIPFSNCKLHVCLSFWSYLHYCLALTYNIFGGWDFPRVTSKRFGCLCSLLFSPFCLLCMIVVYPIGHTKWGITSTYILDSWSWGEFFLPVIIIIISFHIFLKTCDYDCCSPFMILIYIVLLGHLQCRTKPNTKLPFTPFLV